MDDGRTKFKQEPLSPGPASRHGHDLMAMQQTYHQGEVLSHTGTQGALDMSQSGRTATIAAGMPYIPDTMTSYALTAHDVTPAYAIQDRNLMLGMYGYAPVISEGKGAGHVVTNGLENTEVNGCDGTGPSDSGQPKLRNTALPGMGKRSHLPKRYKCAMCAYRTRYKSDLNRHVRKHAIATFNCEICNMPFKTIGNVEFHKRKEHADLLTSTATTTTSSSGKDQPPKHSCKHCDYSTSYSSDLTRHIRKHFSSKFHCSLCNRPFMTFSSLATHKRTAHNTSEVVESEGDGGFAGGGSMVESKAIEDNEVLEGDGVVIEDDGAIEVDMAEKDVTASPGDARERSGGLSMKQVNVESKEKMVVEDENRNIAEKVPEEETNVNKDQTSPTKISNSPDSVVCTKYTCEYCDKSFGRKLVLEYHLKNIHKIVRSGQEDTGVFVEYPDDDYDLALDMSIQELENSTSDGLADRTLDTNGKLRHQCQLCAYATNYKSTFDRHVRKHDLECHICDICRMPFITFGHLQRHIRDNHPEHTQSGIRKEQEGHQERPAVNARKESVEGRSTVYDFQPNDPHPRVTNAPSPSRCDMDKPGMSQNHFNWMTVNKPSVHSPGRGDIGGAVGTKYNWTGQRRVSNVEEGVSPTPPTSGRYAKLVSDYDSFAEKPFACSLCFYRTGDISSLVEHAENHLTGCSLTSVSDTCMFRVGSSMLHGGTDLKHPMRCPVLPTYNVYAPSSASERNREERPKGLTKPNEISQSQFMYSDQSRVSMSKDIKSDQGAKSLSRCQQENQDKAFQEKKITMLFRQQSEITEQQMSNIDDGSVTVADSQRKNDRMIPTFSVHYRKDKTNKVRPYLCLLCRKRFRHLMLLKQHFKVAHSESQVGSPRYYTCCICKEVFNNPMLLQEHHDINH